MYGWAALTGGYSGRACEPVSYSGRACEPVSSPYGGLDDAARAPRESPRLGFGSANGVRGATEYGTADCGTAEYGIAENGATSAARCAAGMATRGCGSEPVCGPCMGG